MLAASGTALLAVLSIAACDGTSPTAAEASVSADVIATHGDTAAVTAVSAAWDAAWNAGNAAGIGALFVDDAEFVNGRGQVAVGATTITANHAANLAGPFRGSHTVGTVRRITFLSGTIAVLDVDNELTGFSSLPGGAVPTQPGLNRGRHKRVLVKRSGEWRTVLMQITSVAPAATP
jgi:uncharacterized protein (TIGR02246 family)